MLFFHKSNLFCILFWFSYIYFARSLFQIHWSMSTKCLPVKCAHDMTYSERMENITSINKHCFEIIYHVDIHKSDSKY